MMDTDSINYCLCLTLFLWKPILAQSHFHEGNVVLIWEKLVLHWSLASKMGTSIFKAIWLIHLDKSNIKVMITFNI